VVGTRIFNYNLKRALRLAERIGMPAVYFFQMPFPYKEQAPPEPRPGVRYGCPSAWRQLIVERDGNLKPCCYLETSLGNSAAAPLEQQFNGDSARALRRTFVEGDYIEKCKGCGQFTQISDEQTREILKSAQHRINAGDFSDEVRTRLQSAHDECVALARARGITA
jgi:radical SAM protein with 4Fe4S-binding SPASM domain